MGLGSAAPALQLARIGSYISVESSWSDPVQPPVTRRICNNEVVSFDLDKLIHCTKYVLKFTHSLSSSHVAGAGVGPSPGVETREILLPSLFTVHGHYVEVIVTTRDHHCVSVRIRDGTGRAVINNFTNSISTSQHSTLTLHYVLMESLSAGSRQI